MAFVRYEEAPVTLSIAGAPCTMLATTVTAGENLPLQAVRALGYNGAVAVTSNGPVDGTWSVTYHLVKTVNADAGCGGSSSAPEAACASFYGPEGATTNFALQRGFAEADRIRMNIGLEDAESSIFHQGIATSFTVAAEPNAIITATLAGNYYDCAMTQKQIAGTDVKTGRGDMNIAHGSKADTTSTGLGFGCKPFSANYEASRGLSPIYSLGSLSAQMVMITDPQQTITLQGENLPKSVVNEPGLDAEGDCSATASPLCLVKTTVNFDIEELCSTDKLAEYEVCGFVQSRDIELAENDVLRGNITVVDYTFPQKLDTPDCT